MKHIVYLLVCSLLFFTSCKEEEVNPSVKPPTVVKTPLYIGKYLYTKDAEKIIAKIPFQKSAHISVLTGCECSDEVGEHSTTKSSSQDDNQKEMIVAGDMLEYIKSLDKNLLQHLYVYYMYTNECDTCESGGSGDLVIVGLFLNIQDDVPLEKVTRYTVGKSTSIVSVGNNTPNKQVTPNRVVIPPVAKKQQPVQQPPKTVTKTQEPVKQATKVEPVKKDQNNVAKGKSTAKNVQKPSPPKKKR